MTEYTVGIDLGTSNSCVAIFRDNHLEIIENEQGHRVTPSWVTFTEDVVLTGNEAIDLSHKYLKNTVFEAKRLIGQRYDDPKVKEDIKRMPYKVINDLGSLKIEIAGENEKIERYYPEEISAYILRKMKEVAEARLNTSVNRAVVTVPAYFNDAQRQATIDAAKIAKFQTINVINEPTAAALAFHHKNKKDYRRNVVVYDFGGGTFDVSVVTVGRGKCEVKATQGDSHLGGTDIDMKLVSYIKEEFKTKYQKEINDDDDIILRRLKNMCESAKKKLSGASFQVDMELDAIVGDEDTAFSLSRTRFEQLNQDLFDKTLNIVDECLKSSGFTKDDIDEAVLVGGSSRIPKIQQMLKDYFGEDKVNKGVNPDEAVAYGAAIHASTLAGNKNELTVYDVTSLPLGTNTYGDRMNFVIPKNARLPAKAIKRYETILDNQEAMDFPIYQGESQIASENFELGHFTMNDLSQAPAKGVIVEVTFQLDAEGLLKVTAKEINASNNVKNIEIDVRKNGLSEEQIKKRILETEENKDNEGKQRTFSEARCKFEDLLGKARQHADNFKDDEQNKILDEIDVLHKWFDKVKIGNLDEFPAKEQTLKNLLSTTP